MKRILVKLSGEALAGSRGFGIEPAVVKHICAQLRPVVEGGTRVAIVVGGGNLFRGAELARHGMNRIRGDHVGMLATVMNGLSLCELFDALGLKTRLLSAFEVPGIVPRFTVADGEAALGRREVLMLAGGTGNPLFTTDTAACLRAIELGMDAVFKATQVDGVYSADPKVDPKAQRYDHLSYDDAIAKELKVMDLAAFALCREHNLPIHVFDLAAEGALGAILAGSSVGTRIDRDGPSA